MQNKTNTRGMLLASASAAPGFQHFGAVSGALSSRYASRNRIPVETMVIGALCAVVCALVVTGEVDRDQLFADYDLKLQSYGDRLTLFTVATIPSVAGLAAVYVGFRGIQGIRAMFAW